MKKNFASFLVLVLIALQVMSLVRIGELQNDLRNMRNQLDYLESNQSSQMNNMYANVESMLQRQSSILDSYDYFIGEIDRDSLKVPVTFRITPKETKADTKATLYTAEESVAMSKNGTTYTATLGIDVFGSLEAKVVLADSGLERTEKLEIFENLQGKLLPAVYARLEREGGTAIYTKRRNELAGEYRCKGNLSLEVKPVQNNSIEKARLSIEVDGKVVSEEPVNTDTNWSKVDKKLTLSAVETVSEESVNTDTNWSKVDKKLTLSAGETLTLSVIATDSLGLNYTTIIERLTLDENADPVHGEEWRWLGEVVITDDEGKVLNSHKGY